MDNANTREYLDKIRTQVVENLKRTAFAPSVQMTDVPRESLVDGMDDEAEAILDDLDEDENKDKRFTRRRFDQYIEKPGELSDSEDEDENAANGVSRKPDHLKRRNQVNYRLDLADSGVESGMATPQDASSVPDDEMDTGVDEKMTEAPEPVAGSEAQGTSSAAEAPSRADNGSVEEPSGMAIDTREPAPTSVPVSRPDSPKPDEDTAMEDAEATAPETEQKDTPAPSETKDDKPANETPAADNATESTPQTKAPSESNEGEEQKEPEATKEAEPTETGTTEGEKTTEAPQVDESPAVKPELATSKSKEPSAEPRPEAAQSEE